MAMRYLEFARRQKGWSQAQLSGVTRIGAGFISQIERGTGIPNPDQAERLARALGLHPDQLLRPVPDPEKEPV
jgi:transcriptional regulator with XRE-family HTH domain